MKQIVAPLAAGILAWACAGPTWGQGAETFPAKPVRIIVPFPAGGTADSIPRIVAEKLALKWSQPVIVENRPGAGGNIGADAFARAEPDGYTLFASPPGPMAINFNLYKKLGYDARRFAPISQPAVSQHLKVLREAGLVTVRAEGTRRFYALDGDGLDAAEGWLAHLRDPMAAFAQPLDALATEVARGRRAARRAATSSRAAQVGTDRDASGAAGA